MDTPNSTMAVRGTVFRVEVREGKDGKIYTYLAVLNGAVKVELKTTEGKYNGVSETIPAGTAAAIRADETFSEFIGGSGGKHTAPIDYAAFPAGTLRQIIAYIDDNEEIDADRDELEALLKQKLSEANGDEKHKHSWQTVTVREADCARTGLQKTVCAVCGETKGQKTLPRAAHKLSGWTVKTKATCESKGLKVKKCGVCGKIIERRQTAALAHQPKLRLVRFGRVRLAAGEEVQIAVSLDARCFALYDWNGKEFAAHGGFTLYAGGCLPDDRSKALGATSDWVSASFSR